MDEEQYSSSEEDVDEEELEVALYSQIHFDPVQDSFAQTTHEFFPNTVQPSFEVGVQSYSPKNPKHSLFNLLNKAPGIKKKQAIFNHDFIGFSEDSVNSEIKSNSANSQQKEANKSICNLDFISFTQNRNHKEKEEKNYDNDRTEEKEITKGVEKAYPSSDKEVNSIDLEQDPSSADSCRDVQHISKDSNVAKDSSLGADLTLHSSSGDNQQSLDISIQCISDDSIQDESCFIVSSDIEPDEKEIRKDINIDNNDIWSNFDESDDVCLIAAEICIDEPQNSTAGKDQTDREKFCSKQKVVTNAEEEEGNSVVTKTQVKTHVHNIKAAGKDQTDREKFYSKKKMAKNAEEEEENSFVTKTQVKTHDIKAASDKPMPPNLLPFSITKAPKNVKKISAPAPEEPTVVKTVKNTRKRVACVAPATKKEKSSKLEEFLKISSGDTSNSDLVKLKKNKKLSKQEAAVKPRKPPVVLRRPRTVVVKYHQHSDTNTDYSDSEESNTLSPMKASKTSGLISSSKIPQKSKPKPETESQAKSSDEDVIIVKDKLNTKSVVGKNKNGDDDDEETGEGGSRTGVEEETNELDKGDIEEDAEEEEEEDNISDSSLAEEDVDSEEEIINNAGLDFNLTGGVEALLKTQTRDSSDDKSDDKWAIENEDRNSRLGPKIILNRYFNPKVKKCRNCNEEGHLAVACTKEKKIVCTFCGTQGHHFSKCPDGICFNCNCPGHRSNDCMEPKKNWYVKCQRCWMQGHTQDTCPDLWRQYHITTQLDSRKIVKPKSKKNSNTNKENWRINCYNCGKKGHWGFECYKERMNRFAQPFYPFIAEYEKKERKSDESNRNMKDKAKGRKDEHKRIGRKDEHEHSGRKTEHSIAGKKRKAEKAGDTSKRKVSKHKTNDADMTKIEDLSIRIDQNKLPSQTAVKSKASKNKKKTNNVKERNKRETFVSGNTTFRYQEPSNPKYSSQQTQNNPKHFYYEDADFDYPQSMDSDVFEQSRKRYSNLDDFSYHDDEYERKGGMSRKAKQRTRRGKEEDDLIDDMRQHQVSHNEWWKGDNQQGDYEPPEVYYNESKRDKKNRKRKQQTASSTSQSNYYDNNAEYSESKRAKGHSSHPHSSYETHQNYYPHPQQQQDYEEGLEEGELEEYIVLDSTYAKDRSKGSYRNKNRNWKGKSNSKRNVGGGGFKARDWVMSMY